MFKLSTRLMVSATALLAATAALPAQAAEAPAADAATTIGELIVTAQRREERLKDVPISMTVVGGEQLQQAAVTNTRDLSQLTPGLRIDRVGVFTQPNIRGISTGITALGTDNPVAIYVDGVYQQSLYGATFELSDISRIEVLKGPQGTLFGRNATGGAIQVHTLAPEFDYQGRAFASYGRFNDVNVAAFVTGPINDKLAFSLAGGVHNNEGYHRDILHGNQHVGGLESRMVRGKLLFRPTETLNFTLAGFWSQRNDANVLNTILNGNSSALNTPGAIVPRGKYEVASDLVNDARLRVRSFGVSLRGELEMEAGTLTSLSAFNRWETKSTYDGDNSSAPILFFYSTNPEQGYSQELNFASRDFGKLSFVTGVFYFNGYGSTRPARTKSSLGAGSDVAAWAHQRIEAGAVYGEATYAITDQLSLIAGLRYSRETRELEGATRPAAAPRPAEPSLDKRTDSATTPRITLKYKATDDINLYATYSRGFKSGTYNSGALTASAVQVVTPEKVTAYEVGFKSTFDRLDLNAAAFYYDYDNIQVSALRLINGVQTSLIQNAASARIYGAEIQAVVHVTDAFRVSAGVSLLDAKFRDFPGAAAAVPNATNRGNVNTFVDATGNHLVRSPEATVNLTANYKTELAGGDLDLSATLYHSAKYYFDNANRVSQPAYTTLDARAGWSPPGSDLTFAVYGRNLTGKDVIQSTFLAFTGDGVLYAPPASWGVSIAYKF